MTKTSPKKMPRSGGVFVVNNGRTIQKEGPAIEAKKAQKDQADQATQKTMPAKTAAASKKEG